ncbi:Bax inhibitor-1 family protein [uncultured Clostridium sp.]|uniref:Bax inhibitor-1/YccA family protein n=1 Tax=uncultured Clostridium sp. TaxID=59620 RepID=UPI0026390B77|nr:Bax inhibitor-1 family protein [uncultured Clostridium sp.]
MNVNSKANNYMVNPMQTIFTSLAISLVFMGLGFLFGIFFVPIQVAYMANRLIGIVFIGLIVLSMFSRKSVIPRSFPIGFVYGFTFIYGVILYPVLMYYLQALGAPVFFSVIAGAIVLFAILAFQASRKEAGYYMSMGNVLFAGLIAIIVASVINIFVFSSFVSVIISAVSVVIFAAYVMYDISIMKMALNSGYVRDKNDLSIFVLNLYLDLINLILNLLNIAGYLDNR